MIYTNSTLVVLDLSYIHLGWSTPTHDTCCVGLAYNKAWSSVEQSQVENNVFTRDFHDIPDNTLLIPIHNIEDENHGPFTEAQVKKQTSWPEWKAAADKEIEQIAARDVYDLVD
jgi:hypothetical protein